MSGIAWGGSEELWCRAAHRLQNNGHHICVNFKWWPRIAQPLAELERRGADIRLRNPPPTAWQRRLAFLRHSNPSRNGGAGAWLKEERPDLVVITVGYHADRLEIADVCRQHGIPYAINVQSASSSIFVHANSLDAYRNWYQHALRVFFVSEENQHKIETNLAMTLDNAEIIDNPFNVDPTLVPAWPDATAGLRLACVGRIHFQSKAQDLIVDVMRQDKWRSRPLVITFYGRDQGNQRQLTDLIAIHGLESQLVVAGFCENVNRIWAENHGLILASRYEGAPLCVVEAMLCNRLCIVTDTGRNRVLMDDGESGFVIPGATAPLLDDTLERAWQARERWESMGQLAGQHIRQRHAIDPIGRFAARIERLAQES